ncbi:hypothetical protein OIO90_004503 [Microbotryomycetes sp. JL221]|nr:hypothetical protein OIO90_004503 [Microbotryomycetes sp. JL221]
MTSTARSTSVDGLRSSVDDDNDKKTNGTSSSSSRVLGTMVVLVMRAKNLQNRVRLGKQNPYATVTFGLNKKRTAAIERGGQQPTWDSEFRFEIMRDPMEQLRDEAQAVVDKRGGVMPVTSSVTVGGKDKLQDLAGQTTVGVAQGKRVLRLAVYADDPRDPRLVGEGWVSLERKNRYAGEVKLELTWYWSDPPKSKTRSRSPAPGAYGGPGSRTAADDIDGEGTQTWDEASDVGSSTSGPIDLGPDYPDPDLAPLSQSMSKMGLNTSQRGPLPAPPTVSGRATSGYTTSYSGPHHHGANGYSTLADSANRRPSHADLAQAYSQGYTSQYSPTRIGEFGGYDGQYGQATLGPNTRGYSSVESSGFAGAAPRPYSAQDSYPQQPSAPGYVPAVNSQIPSAASSHRHAPLPQPPVARPSAATALAHSQSLSSLQGGPAMAPTFNPLVPPQPPLPPSFGHEFVTALPHGLPPPPIPYGTTHLPQLPVPPPPQPPLPPSMQRPPSIGALPPPPSVMAAHHHHHQPHPYDAYGTAGGAHHAWQSVNPATAPLPTQFHHGPPHDAMYHQQFQSTPSTGYATHNAGYSN